MRCLDPRADLALFRTLPAHLEEVVSEPNSGDAFTGGSSQSSLRQRLLAMTAQGLGAIQIADPKGVETANPSQEFDRLFEEHVLIRRPLLSRPAPREGSRRWIQGRVREALERHQLWDRLNQNVSVAEFTAPGDAFRLDFSYRPNGLTKYLHALSLESDWNQAKVLSYTFWKIRARQPATLTAIVADAHPEPAAAQSCRKLLLGAEIQLQPLSGLDGFLEGVGNEMRPLP